MYKNCHLIDQSYWNQVIVLIVFSYSQAPNHGHSVVRTS